MKPGLERVVLRSSDDMRPYMLIDPIQINSDCVVSEGEAEK